MEYNGIKRLGAASPSPADRGGMYRKVHKSNPVWQSNNVAGLPSQDIGMSTVRQSIYIHINIWLMSLGRLMSSYVLVLAIVKNM